MWDSCLLQLRIEEWKLEWMVALFATEFLIFKTLDSIFELSEIVYAPSVSDKYWSWDGEEEIPF